MIVQRCRGLLFLKYPAASTMLALKRTPHFILALEIQVRLSVRKKQYPQVTLPQQEVHVLPVATLECLVYVSVLRYK